MTKLNVITCGTSILSNGSSPEERKFLYASANKKEALGRAERIYKLLQRKRQHNQRPQGPALSDLHRYMAGSDHSWTHFRMGQQPENHDEYRSRRGSLHIQHDFFSVWNEQFG